MCSSDIVVWATGTVRVKLDDLITINEVGTVPNIRRFSSGCYRGGAR